MPVLDEPAFAPTIVVSIDPATGDTVTLSVPRDFSGINLPEGMGIWEYNSFLNWSTTST